MGMGRYEDYHIEIVTGQALEDLRKILIKTAERDLLYGAPLYIGISAKEDKEINYADAGCILTTMLLATRAEGLDSCYMWGTSRFAREDDNINKICRLPEGYKMLSGAVFGYGEGENPDPTLSDKIEFIKVK